VRHKTIPGFSETGIAHGNVARLLVYDPRRPIDIHDIKAKEELSRNDLLDFGNEGFNEATNITEVQDSSLNDNVIAAEVHSSKMKGCIFGGGNTIQRPHKEIH
jgi:hypothetical protein